MPSVFRWLEPAGSKYPTEHFALRNPGVRRQMSAKVGLAHRDTAARIGAVEGKIRAIAPRHAAFARTETQPWIATVATPGLSDRIAVVVSQQASQPLSALDLALVLVNLIAGHDELVAQPLMISFAVIMGKVRGDGSSQRRFTEKDHSQTTVFFDTSHETFDVRRDVR